MKLPSSSTWTDKYQPAKFCSSWFQVWWQFHSHQAVFIKFIWFRFWQNSGPKLQNFFGLSLHPKGIWSHLEPGIYSSTLGQIKDSQGQRRARGERKINHFQPVFAKGVGSRPTPEKSRTCRGCSQIANLDLPCWRQGHLGPSLQYGGPQPQGPSLPVGLSFQPKLCDTLQVPSTQSFRWGVW